MRLSEAEEIQLEKDLDEELRCLASEKMLAFTTYTKPDYVVHWHHKVICDALDDWIAGRIQFLMLFAPPRHGKSEIVSRRLPAFIHGKFPKAQIMCASYLDSLASDMCMDVQKILESKEYKKVFPEIHLPQPRSHYTKGIRNSLEHTLHDAKGKPLGGKYMGSGIGGSFTGKGADFIIVDDPIKGRNIADSEAFREQLWNFWTNDLFSRLETDLQSGRKGQALITMTRWHEDDLAGRLLDLARKDSTAIQWKVIHLPAIKVSTENEYDPRNIGEALWPDKYNLEDLGRIKATTTPRGWSAVYQQDPVPGDGGIFKERMFKIVELPKKFDWMFTTSDTAYKEKQDNDYTVFSVWGVLDGELYLVDVFREQIKAAEIEDKVYPFLIQYAGYGYRATLIEDKGHGIYLNQKWANTPLMIPSEEDLKEFFSDRRLDKVERANNIAPYLARKVVYIGINIFDKEGLIAEALGFPNKRFDDWVDTLIDAVKKVHMPGDGLGDAVL